MMAPFGQEMLTVTCERLILSGDICGLCPEDACLSRSVSVADTGYRQTELDVNTETVFRVVALVCFVVWISGTVWGIWRRSYRAMLVAAVPVFLLGVVWLPFGLGACILALGLVQLVVTLWLRDPDDVWRGPRDST
jgi:hypothetical protein